MKTSKPTTDVVNNLGPSMPEIAPRPTVSAAAALGLPESPHDTLANAVSKMRKDNKSTPMNPFSNGVTEDDDDEVVVEKPAAKAKPVAKPTDKKVSTKPKLISEKPIVDGEVQDEEVESDNVEDSDNKGDEPEAKAPTAAAKPEETEAFKKLAKEHEDTKKRLDEVLAKINTTAAPKAETPKVETPKSATPEEIKKEEQAWIQDAVQYLDADLSEDDHNAILDGGPTAVAKVIEMRKKDMAQSILKARQLINSDFNPVAEKLMNEIRRMAPVYEDYIKTQSFRVEQAFTGKYPDVKPYMTTVRQVSNALFQKYPDKMATLSEQETFDEVYSQTVTFLKSLGVDVKAAAAPAAAAPVVTPPAAPAAAPAASQTPSAPAAAAPMPKPPGSTAPGAISQATPDSKEKNKAIAASLTY